MKRPKLDPAELERAEAAIRRLWEEGCPVAQDAPVTARVALRRWHSVDRRQPKTATREVRINDVANGLIQAFERDPGTVGPLKRDYICVAEAVVKAAEEIPSD